MMNPTYAKILNQKIEKKADLDRDFMTVYVVVNGNDDDKLWWAEIVRETLVKRKNNVREGEDCISLNLKIAREKFCLRYEEFYHFSSEYKKEKAREKARENDILTNFANEFGIDLNVA